MANAPIPGSHAESVAARQFLRIRVKDRTMDLVPSLPLKEKFVIRAATGTAFEAFLPQQTEREFGEDSLFILWWVARRQNGEPTMSFAEAEKQWPTGLSEDDVDLTEMDLDDPKAGEDTPEGSGPAS